MSRKALGKGLDAIFGNMGTEVVDAATGQSILEIELEKITPNPYQPRREFNEAEIKELADSIREKGLLQPVLLRRHAGGFQIVAGERRFRAMKLLEKPTISAQVREKLTDRDMMEMALIENIQRVQLNAIEEAKAYDQLISECGLTHEDLSKQVGKSRSAITNSLRLMKLHPQVQEWIQEGKLTAGHGRALLQSATSKQEELAKRILDQNMNVRAAEKTRNQQVQKPTASLTPDLQAFVEKLRFALGTKVSLRGDGKKGVLEIHYFSQEDLENLGRVLAIGSEAAHSESR